MLINVGFGSFLFWICFESELDSSFIILIEGVLSLSWIQVSFILIEGVCLGLGKFYGL